jgi:murein DD-endopeptidase MepM/ murein hydrolase activator NlpD
VSLNLVLSDHRFLTTRPGFSARGLLERIGSPRLGDMPSLPEWIDGAADEGGVSRELMCVVPQKEQSALTKSDLSDWARRAFCGYGVSAPGVEPKPEWRGPRNQLRAAAKRFGWLQRHARELARDTWIAKAGAPFAPGGDVICTPENAATAALYTYTPGAPGRYDDKRNILRIWSEFGFGDPLEEREGVNMGLIAPMTDFEGRRINNTLHGRSVYRSRDVPGHNVFKGWSTWASNGHKGVGAGLDVGGKGWVDPVLAICDGELYNWRNDTSKLEVVYLRAPGVDAVYAHINFQPERTLPARVKQGESIGVVRGDLNWPHLHFELWLNGKAVAAPTPRQLRDLMMGKFAMTDHGEPSPWAREAWDKAVALGVVGDGPEEPVTKQQVMVYLDRLGLLDGDDDGG